MVRHRTRMMVSRREPTAAMMYVELSLLGPAVEEEEVVVADWCREVRVAEWSNMADVEAIGWGEIVEPKLVEVPAISLVSASVAVVVASVIVVIVVVVVIVVASVVVVAVVTSVVVGSVVVISAAVVGGGGGGIKVKLTTKSGSHVLLALQE